MEHDVSAQHNRRCVPVARIAGRCCGCRRSAQLDLAPTCDAAARFSILVGRDKEACREDEHTAESTLAQNWSKYNAVDKTQCIGNVKTGGPASFVELLSCLEIMRDAKKRRPACTVGPAGTVAADDDGRLSQANVGWMERAQNIAELVQGFWGE
jgi:hypothetical protein